MPNRPKPGSARSRGGGIDLGAILLGIGDALGGVEVDPSFNKEAGPTPNGDPLGNNPYKAKTVFDRKEASTRNAEYKVGEVGKDNDVARALLKQERQIPIEARSKQTLGEIENANKAKLEELLKQIAIKFAPQETDEAIRRTQGEAAARMFGALNVDPRNAKQQATYNELVGPEVLASHGAKNRADTQSSIFSAAKSNQDLEHLKATADSTARAALNNSEFGARTAESRVANANQLIGNMIKSDDLGIIGKALENKRANLLPVDSEAGLLDLTKSNFAVKPVPKAVLAKDPTTGEDVFTQPDPQSRLQVAPQQQQPGRFKVDDLIIDPATGEVLGVKPRR